MTEQLIPIKQKLTDAQWDALIAERASKLKEISDQLKASVRYTEPDDSENWEIIFDQDTRRPYWVPRDLHDAWQNLRFGYKRQE